MRHNKDGVQNWFNPFGHFNYLLVLTLSTLVSAQSFEDFKQSQFKAYEDDKSAKEREFRSFLDKEWKAYKAYQGIKVYEKPKPKTLPVSSVKVSIPVGPPIVLKPVKKEIPRKPPEVKKPEIQKPALPKIVEPKPVVVKPPKQKPLWKIVMFDTTFEFDREKSLEKGVFEPRNKTGITNFFDTLSQSDYKALVERLGLHVKSYQLNDWALYLLSAKLSQKLYTDESEQKLFQWFILNQLGYDVKVALALERVVLLSKSKKLIYSTPNYTLSKNRYYAVDYYNKKGLGSLRTYEGNYPDAIKSLDLSLSVIPAWQREDKTRALEFRYRGQKFSLHVNYNQNLIDFMSTYPQADYDSYFNAPLDH
ncbi:MAG: hypothetical protein U9N52_08810, partial [Campylobacterota bacterium]|nr:hypothetical protein [Campylobacterota bacterium]